MARERLFDQYGRKNLPLLLRGRGKFMAMISKRSARLPNRSPVTPLRLTAG
jgi:hypothetical protein